MLLTATPGEAVSQESNVERARMLLNVQERTEQPPPPYQIEALACSQERCVAWLCPGTSYPGHSSGQKEAVHKLWLLVHLVFHAMATGAHLQRICLYSTLGSESALIKISPI